MKKIEYLEKQKQKLKEAKESSISSHIDKESKKFDLMWQDMKTSSDITKDNIHLYYEFMSDNEKYKKLKILDSKIKLYNGSKKHFEDIELLLIKKVVADFNINVYSIDIVKNYFSVYYSTGNINSPRAVTHFTKKPIEKYLEEIKESEAYKEYILKNKI